MEEYLDEINGECSESSCGSRLIDDCWGGQGMNFSKEARVRFVDGLGGKFGNGLKHIENEILHALERQKEGGEGRVLVVLDGLDFLVAGMGAEVEEVMDMVQEIRDVSGF